MDLTYKPPNQSRLNTMRCNFANLKVIVTDEISMLGFFLSESSILCITRNISDLHPAIRRNLNSSSWSPVTAQSSWTKSSFQYGYTRGDPRFAEILKNFRVGTLTQEDEQDLKNLEHTDTSKFSQDTVHLFRTNQLAALYNEQQLKTLPEPHLLIHCQDTKKISTQTQYLFKSPAPIYMKPEDCQLQ
ncbi:hypothetical protein MAR_032160 [Mya arenaria]|uniref:DNA helicase n=1 Tax=Mya arenaria TaxID=6604 RepID=A0ABY7F983_MYAAR|nr:hypothetical protein MAR_032160 [Mya arenaria]